jgi:putative endonuclease
MTNQTVGTLYIGMTNNIERRVSEHKLDIGGTFTKKYKLDKLVYYEHFTDVNAAIRHEKNLKGWDRAWKVRLIEKRNPEWRDLSADFAVTDTAIASFMSGSQT